MLWHMLAPVAEQTEALRTRVLVIGAGPAGYTAAIYAARAKLEPILIAGASPGGQLMSTSEVENYPGFDDIVDGPALMERMRIQAVRVGTRMFEDVVAEVDVSRSPFRIFTESGVAYEADTVIICTGAQARWLGIPSEQALVGSGVSACAVCDASFYQDRPVAVIGGGNTAVEEALYLTKFAKHVTLVHRRDKLRAEKILQDKLLSHPKISVVWDHVVGEIIGDVNTGVRGLSAHHVQSGSATELNVAGIFVAIGHTPQTSLFRGKIALDDEGYILTRPDSTTTSVPGIFAAGDVKDKVFRQAVTAAGSGCMAALEAERFLSETHVEPAAERAVPA
jgi:thioredoxin reductase (NADPH)